MEVTSQPDAVPIWIIAGHLEADSEISPHAGASEAVSPSDVKTTFGWREDGSPGVLQRRTHSSPDSGKNSLVSGPLVFSLLQSRLVHSPLFPDGIGLLSNLDAEEPGMNFPHHSLGTSQTEVPLRMEEEAGCGLDQSSHAVLHPVQNFGSPSAQQDLTSWSAERGLAFPGQEPTCCCCGSYLSALHGQRCPTDSGAPVGHFHQAAPFRGTLSLQECVC